jgi:3-dehydroquinate dehydratase
LIWPVADFHFFGMLDHHNLKKEIREKKKKIDLIIKILDSKNGNTILKELEAKYPKKRLKVIIDKSSHSHLH